MTDSEQRREWHLDRKVTLSLIFALLANAGATVWFAAQLDHRVATVEEQQERSMQTPSRITRLETQFENVRDDLQRIESKLDRIIEAR